MEIIGREQVCTGPYMTLPDGTSRLMTADEYAEWERQHAEEQKKTE
jgi:hypothetical protein